MNSKIIIIMASIFLGSFPSSIFAQTDCASISDPQLMYNCVANQRSKNLEPNSNNSKPLNLGPAPMIKDWKKVGSFAGGKVTFYYSPNSAKYAEISDSQSATGSSRAVIINTLQDFSSPQGSGSEIVQSNIITAVYHCNLPNMKEMRFEAHAGKMGTEKIVSVHEEPSSKKWDSLSEGDDVVIEYVRSICPAIGPKYPKGPLKIMFACTDLAPNVARFKTEKILKEIITYGAESASRMMVSYGGCSAQNGDVTNSDYLKKAQIIGTKNDLGYYVIDTDPNMSFGVVGR